MYAKSKKNLPRVLLAVACGWIVVGCSPSSDGNDNTNGDGNDNTNVNGDGNDNTNGGGDPAEFTAADGIRGGQLYDKFWASETGFDQDDPNRDTFDASSNFFRCKQCHGWDLLGNLGAYIDRAPRTSRPNVTGIDLAEHAQEESAQDLFDSIKTGSGVPRRDADADLSMYDPDDSSTTALGDQMPDYGQILTDEQIWDLVKFLKEEALDTTELYDITTTGSYPDGSKTFSAIGKDGDPTNGDAIFADGCASCHGADGTQFLVDGDEFTMGSFFRSKPNEAQHKVKFGQLGTGMVPPAVQVDNLSDMKDLYRAMLDEDLYPDP